MLNWNRKCEEKIKDYETACVGLTYLASWCQAF